jgi:hypothetical protein
VGGCRARYLPGLAAALVCLSHSLDAQPLSDRAKGHNYLYTASIPAAGIVSRFEVGAGYSSTGSQIGQTVEIVAGRGIAPAIRVGDWEITVAVDTVRCEVHCSYRRVAQAFGQTTLVAHAAPPLTVIRLYTGAASNPATLIIDPARLNVPTIRTNSPVSRGQLFLSARRSSAPMLVAIGIVKAHSTSIDSPAAGCDSEPTVPSVIPLRI